MSHVATLFFPSSSARAELFAQALAPEVAAEARETSGGLARAHTLVTARADGLEVVLSADEVALLRAAVNATLRCLGAAEQAADLGQS